MNLIGSFKDSFLGVCRSSLHNLGIGVVAADRGVGQGNTSDILRTVRHEPSEVESRIEVTIDKTVLCRSKTTASEDADASILLIIDLLIGNSINRTLSGTAGESADAERLIGLGLPGREAIL